MRFPVKIEYASRAILELALHWPNEQPLNMTAIARRQKIPLKFLTQILLDLKKMGLAESLRGQQGGYHLIKTPKEISLDTILKFYVPAHKKHLKAQKSSGHVFDEIFEEADNLFHEYLEKITFEDLKKRELATRDVASYDI